MPGSTRLFSRSPKPAARVVKTRSRLALVFNPALCIAAGFKLRDVVEVKPQRNGSIAVTRKQPKRRCDFLQLACAAANSRLPDKLSRDDLLQSLLTGKVRRARELHLRAMLERIPVAILTGILDLAGDEKSRVLILQNLRHIALTLDATERALAKLNAVTPTESPGKN